MGNLRKLSHVYQVSSWGGLSRVCGFCGRIMVWSPGDSEYLCRFAGDGSCAKDGDQPEAEVVEEQVETLAGEKKPRRKRGRVEVNKKTSEK